VKLRFSSGALFANCFPGGLRQEGSLSEAGQKVCKGNVDFYVRKMLT